MYLQDYTVLEKSANDILDNGKDDVEYIELVIYFLRRTIIRLWSQRASTELISNAAKIQYSLAIYKTRAVAPNLAEPDKRLDEIDHLSTEGVSLSRRTLKLLHKPGEEIDKTPSVYTRISPDISKKNRIVEVSEVSLIRPSQEKTLLLASKLGIEFGNG
jgi:hypothetical protein